MALKEFAPSVSSEMRATILAELAKIEVTHKVKILFAIESGSRAWGFPSPDSDFDVRFVYVHQTDWYLSVFPGRDVIELPIDDELDISGWDLRKALGLLIKPNPVLMEWLSSPIRYIWNDESCADLLSLSGKVAHKNACLYHYLNLGERQWRRNIENPTEVKLKKYFYVLRPALTLRWLRMHEDTPPPMNFQQLVHGTNLQSSTVETLQELIDLKSRTKEIGTGERIPVLDALIDEEFELARQVTPIKLYEDVGDDADQLLAKLMHRHADMIGGGIHD